MTDDLAAQFDRAMHRILERAAALKPPLTFPGFRGMLAEHGGKGTADVLLAQSQVSEGFTKLVLHSLETGSKDALQLTVESLVLEEPWRQLFTRAQLRTAERRLREVGYAPMGDAGETLQPLIAAGAETERVAAELGGRPKKRVRDLPPVTRDHPRYAEIVDSEGWVPLILCDNVGCYWNAFAAQTRDGRTVNGISTAAREHLLTLLQSGKFGQDASNAFVDHVRWEQIRDNLLNWPNAEIINRDNLRILPLRRGPTMEAGSDTPLQELKGPLPLGPTTGPRPISWTAVVSRSASGQSHAYVFQFGDRDAWKVGHAMDVEARLADVNRHVPYEVLGEQWHVCLYHRCASQDAAYTIEQRLLTLLRTSTSVGERVTCSRDALHIAWKAVLAEFDSASQPHSER
jgi:hypothetical protein